MLTQFYNNNLNWRENLIYIFRFYDSNRLHTFLSGPSVLSVSLHLRSPHANWPLPATTSFSVLHRIATCEFNGQLRMQLNKVAALHCDLIIGCRTGNGGKLNYS